MTEEKNDKLAKVGKFFSSTFNKIVNLIIFLIIVGLIVVIGWFWHNDELDKQRMELLEKENLEMKGELEKNETRDLDVKKESVEVSENDKKLSKEMNFEEYEKNNDFTEDKTVNSLNTANWKTYTDEFGIIQFKYPENWSTEAELKKIEQDEHPDLPNLYRNSRYLEESVCESTFNIPTGYGGSVDLCSVGIIIVPKFSEENCVRIENNDYKLCPPFEYSDPDDRIDIFSRSAVFTNGKEKFMLSFEIHAKKGQIKDKYEAIYTSIFDSVEIIK